MDGYNASSVLIDEYHAHPDDSLYNVLKRSQSMRTNPQLFIITTAGTSLSSPCYQEYIHAKQVNEGIVKEDDYFSYIFELDDKNNWDKPDFFYQANPSLGTVKQIKSMNDSLNEARNMPSKKGEFLTKDLNIWLQTSISWIDDSTFIKSVNQKTDIEIEEGDTCYAGLDLGSVNDWCALSLCFPKGNFYLMKHFFFIPEVALREQISLNPFIKEWVNNGLITIAGEDCIDYQYIINTIENCCMTYDVKQIGYDKWQFALIEKELSSINSATTLLPINQDIKSISPLIKNYELGIRNKKIIDTNPIIRWEAGNCCLYTDPNNNVKINKAGGKDSSKKIDGIITSIMAYSQASNLTSNGGSQAKYSVSKVFDLLGI
jgi:phage terminase large subunit-like protein